MADSACSNTHACSCPNTWCENHGRCCACIARHQPSGTVPNCYNQFTELRRPPPPRTSPPQLTDQ